MLGMLFGIGVSICGGYAIAAENAKRSSSWSGVWCRGFVVSLCFAGFAAITHSMPSCIEYDDPGPYGRCVQYADARTDSAEDRAQQILFNTVVGGTIGMGLLARELNKRGISIETYDG